MVNTKLKDILAELEQLKLPVGHYVVTGGAVLAAHGIRGTEDVDLVTDPGLYEVLKAKYPEFKEGHLRISEKVEVKNGAISIADNPEKVMARADLIEGFPFVRLTDLIDIKRKKGRPKDLRDVELINDYLLRQVV